MATHLSVILKSNANELLGQDEAQQLLDRVAKSYPKLVTNLIPNKIQLSTVTQILQNLLSEGIPVKDMRTITEALTISKSEPSDADALTAEVRPKLGRMIIQPLIDPAGKLTVITFAGDLERILESSHQKSDLSPSQTVGKEASPPPHEAAINPDRPTQQKATPTKSNSIKFNVHDHPSRSE